MVIRQWHPIGRNAPLPQRMQYLQAWVCRLSPYLWMLWLPSGGGPSTEVFRRGKAAAGSEVR